MPSQLPPPPPPPPPPARRISPPRPSRRAEGKGDALLNASQALEDLLVDGEIVLQRGSVSPQYISLIPWIHIAIMVVLTLLCGVGFLLAPYYIANWMFLRRCRWYITDRRILSISGLLSLKTEEIGFNRIGETNLSQGLLSRFFNIGTIVVNDTGKGSIKIRFVNNPMELKRLISAKVYESQSR